MTAVGPMVYLGVAEIDDVRDAQNSGSYVRHLWGCRRAAGSASGVAAIAPWAIRRIALLTGALTADGIVRTRSRGHHTCPIAAKVPTAADLGKQFRVRGDILLDGLRGLTGDLFHVMSGAVVAILSMQTRHGREMLLNEVGLPRVPQVLALPVIVGNVFRADRPPQSARVLLGQTLNVKHLRTGQPVGLPRLRRGEQQGR